MGPRGPEYRTAKLRAEGQELSATAYAGHTVPASRKPRQGADSGHDVYGLVRAGNSGTSKHKFVGSLDRRHSEFPNRAGMGRRMVQYRCRQPRAMGAQAREADSSEAQGHCSRR